MRLIREIHAILLEGVRGKNKTPGEFRRSQNWIGGYSISTASYVPPSVDYLNGCLDNFEKFMHENDRLSVAAFMLPESCWIDNYFILQKARREEFLKTYGE